MVGVLLGLLLLVVVRISVYAVSILLCATAPVRAETLVDAIADAYRNNPQLQAQRADVHTVIVDGRVVKHEHRLVDADLARARRVVEETVSYLHDQLGAEEWAAGMSPDIPESKVLDNPYTYTEYADSSTHTR